MNYFLAYYLACVIICTAKWYNKKSPYRVIVLEQDGETRRELKMLPSVLIFSVVAVPVWFFKVGKALCK